MVLAKRLFFGFHSTIQLYIYVTSTLQLLSKFSFARHSFIQSKSFIINLEEEKCICRQGNYRVSLTSLVNPLDSCLNSMARPVVAPLDFGLTVTRFVLSASGKTSPFTWKLTPPSKSLRSKGKSNSTWSHLGSFVWVSFIFSQVSSDKHILSNRSLSLP